MPNVGTKVVMNVSRIMGRPKRCKIPVARRRRLVAQHTHTVSTGLREEVESTLSVGGRRDLPKGHNKL
eukprot:1656220-Rhodomonas_salina.1